MRHLTTRLVLAALTLALFVPAAASGETNRHKYLVLHARAEKELGKRAPGRNVVHQGVKRKDGTTRGVRQSDYRKLLPRLRRLLAPAPAPAAHEGRVAVSAPAQPRQARQQAPSSGGGGCTGMSAESGGAGYGAYNPNGGYIGCYQISPDHFNGGSCSGLGTDPAGQDRCAAIICHTEGAGAWTNPAGQNPCGRLGG